MLLWDHKDAFHKWPLLEHEYTCRWRQWDAGGPVDFDDDAPKEDQLLVLDWIARNA